MKRFIVALVFVGGIAAVAFASLNSNSKATATKKDKQEIKKDQKEKKKDCKHTCPFS